MFSDGKSKTLSNSLDLDPRILHLSIIQNVRAFPKEVCYVPWYCLPIPGCIKRGEGEILCRFRFDFDLFYHVLLLGMLF